MIIREYIEQTENPFYIVKENGHNKFVKDESIDFSIFSPV